MKSNSIIVNYQNRWERYSTIRSRPRRQLKAGENDGYFYPVSRQPLCSHPKIAALDEKSKQYILIQSFYKYANDIAVTETEIVNKTALAISSNRLPINFDYHYRINALTVMVDESYHAYVAMDCIKQIHEHTGVEPLTLPMDIELSMAIRKVKEALDPSYHSCFELIAVCIAENTLTKEMVEMQDKQETNQIFQNIIKDHLTDETRHSGFFHQVLQKAWQEFNEDTRCAIAKVLPNFIKLYLGFEVENAFNRQILNHLGFSQEESDQIVKETTDGFALTPNHPILKNILFTFERAGLFECDKTVESFSRVGWK